MSSNWLRRLLVESIDQSRRKREEEEGPCGLYEYFDPVVGQCSLCSDLCQPQRGTDGDCVLSCPSYLRMKSNDDSPSHYPINSSALSSSSSSSSSSPFSLGLQTVIVIAFVTVVCVVLIVLIVIFGLKILRRKKTTFQPPISEDDIEDKFDPPKTKISSLEITREQVHLISPVEERCQDENRHDHCAVANDDPASLCSNSATHKA